MIKENKCLKCGKEIRITYNDKPNGTFEAIKFCINYNECGNIETIQLDKLNSDDKKGLFDSLVDMAEKNLSYSNDSADESALWFYQMALVVFPHNVEAKRNHRLLDKIVNHKDYNYPIDDPKTLEQLKVFVECCNVKGFERLYEIISDDFVCISDNKNLGRTKGSFIDSIYWIRKGLYGLYTEIYTYKNKERLIPCIKLNDFGVLFFNIENNKIIRAFEYKIEDHIDREKLTKWKE